MSIDLWGPLRAYLTQSAPDAEPSSAKGRTLAAEGQLFSSAETQQKALQPSEDMGRLFQDLHQAQSLTRKNDALLSLGILASKLHAAGRQKELEGLYEGVKESKVYEQPLPPQKRKLTPSSEQSSSSSARKAEESPVAKKQRQSEPEALSSPEIWEMPSHQQEALRTQFIREARQEVEQLEKSLKGLPAQEPFQRPLPTLTRALLSDMIGAPGFSLNSQQADGLRGVLTLEKGKALSPKTPLLTVKEMRTVVVGNLKRYLKSIKYSASLDQSSGNGMPDQSFVHIFLNREGPENERKQRPYSYKGRQVELIITSDSSPLADIKMHGRRALARGYLPVFLRLKGLHYEVDPNVNGVELQKMLNQEMMEKWNLNTPPIEVGSSIATATSVARYNCSLNALFGCLQIYSGL